jgi:tripartite-type tricarboxylate transporter receptor subunit TctC
LRSPATALARSADVPTMESKGYKDFVFATDTVLLAPAKTPRRS